MLSSEGAPQKTPRLEAVVIGASAGGVSALITLLSCLPRPLPVPVVVALHLPPQSASLLPSIFRGRLNVPASEPVDKEPVAAGTIWTAAPDYHLLIDPDRVFSLSLDTPVNFSRPSIDVLFESASEAYGASLIGVVLTGSSRDGADGVRAIATRGGRFMVQDPSTAEFASMPQAALEIGEPDFVGTLEQIGARLRSLMETT